MTHSAPSPEYFAAVGKRVVSVFDPGDHGEVIEWTSRSLFAVRWDNGFVSVCSRLDVDPEIPDGDGHPVGN